MHLQTNIDAVLAKLAIPQTDDYVYAPMPPGLPTIRQGRRVFKRLQPASPKFWGLVISPLLLKKAILERSFPHPSPNSSDVFLQYSLPLLRTLIDELLRHGVEIYLFSLENNSYILQNSTDFFLAGVNDDVLKAYYFIDECDESNLLHANLKEDEFVWYEDPILRPVALQKDMLWMNAACALSWLTLFFPNRSFLVDYRENSPHKSILEIASKLPEFYTCDFMPRNCCGQTGGSRGRGSKPEPLTPMLQQLNLFVDQCSEKIVDQTNNCEHLIMLNMCFASCPEKHASAARAANILKKMSQIANNLNYIKLSWQYVDDKPETSIFRAKKLDKYLLHDIYLEFTKVIKSLVLIKNLKEIYFENLWIDSTALLELKQIDKNVSCRFFGCKFSGSLSQADWLAISAGRWVFDCCLVPDSFRSSVGITASHASFFSCLDTHCSIDNVNGSKMLPSAVKRAFKHMIERPTSFPSLPPSIKRSINYATSASKGTYIFYDIYNHQPVHPSKYRLKTYTRVEMDLSGFQSFADKEEVFEKVAPPPYSESTSPLTLPKARGYFYGSCPIKLDSENLKQRLPALTLSDKPILWRLRDRDHLRHHVEWLFECNYKYFHLNLTSRSAVVDCIIDFIIVTPTRNLIPDAFKHAFTERENRHRSQMQYLYCAARAAQMYKALESCTFIQELTIQNNEMHDFLALHFEGAQKDEYYLYHPPGGEHTHYKEETVPGSFLPVMEDPIPQPPVMPPPNPVPQNLASQARNIVAAPLVVPFLLVKAVSGLAGQVAPVSSAQPRASAMPIDTATRPTSVITHQPNPQTVELPPVNTAGITHQPKSQTVEFPPVDTAGITHQPKPQTVELPPVNTAGITHQPKRKTVEFPPVNTVTQLGKRGPNWKKVPLSQFVTLPEFPAATLVEVPSVNSMVYLIQQFSERAKRADRREVYYFPTPESLDSYNKGIKLMNNVGKIEVKTLPPTESLSELGEFIEREGCDKPFGKKLHIVLDLSLFQDTIAQFNSLFPDGEYEQQVQDVTLPRNVKIICIGINPPGLTKSYYLGDDLVRRIDPTAFYQCEEAPPFVQDLSTLPPAQIIDFYRDHETWLQKLLGNFFQRPEAGDEFRPNVRGIIPLCLNKSDTPISVCLRNLPDKGEVRNLYLNMKYFRYLSYYGLYLHVPENIHFYSEEKEPAFYTNVIKQRFSFFISVPLERPKDTIVLNKYLFLELVGEGPLSEALAKESRVIYCVDSFTQMQWAQLAEIFQQAPISVYLIGVAPLPFMMDKRDKNVPPFSLDLSIEVLVVDEPYQYANSSATEKTISIILDNLESNDLQPAHPNAATGQYDMVSPTDFIQRIADKGYETLFLVGVPNFDMRQFLLPLLLNYQPICMPDGKPIHLKIITSNKEWLQGLSYSTPQVAPRSPKPKAISSPVDESARVSAVKAGFSRSPVVWIEGETGCGKTSYTYSELQHCFTSANYYYEIERMEDWLGSVMVRGGISVLVVNEGNLALRQRLSQLMALFIKNACMVVEGKFYYLNSEQRHRLRAVITANPIKGYEGGRRETPLFKWAERMVFASLSWGFISEKLVKPACLRMTMQNLKRLENFYQFSLAKKVILTSRMLVTMAKMLDLAKCGSAQEQYIFWYGASSIFSDRQAREFYSSLKPNWDACEERVEHVYKEPKYLTRNYILLTSREPIYQLLKFFLHIFQNSRPTFGIPQPQLTIFALEGEAGCGKTGLVLATLCEQGYVGVPLEKYVSLERDFTHKKFYIRLSPILVQREFLDKLLSIVEKKKILPLLWIDEDNSSGVDEQILNRVLDVGFNLIVTRNPANSPNYPRRKKTSLAILNRSFVIHMPPYTALEEAARQK